MLNHLHLITANKEDTTLADIMRDFKRFTSTKISDQLEKDNQKLFLYVFRKAAERCSKTQKYKVWQDEYHPEAICTEKWLFQKMEYIHNNPVRKGLVVKPEAWNYSSARNWLENDDSIIGINRGVLF